MQGNLLLQILQGQDIVIAAFKKFALKHKDAVLVTAWHNQWPKLTQTIASMGLVEGIPEVGYINAWSLVRLPHFDELSNLRCSFAWFLSLQVRGHDVVLGPWLDKNGIHRDQVHVMGLAKPSEIVAVLQRADAGKVWNMMLFL